MRGWARKPKAVILADFLSYRYRVVVVLDGVSSGYGKLVTVLEFSYFEGGLDGWVSHGDWFKRVKNE